MEEIKEDPKAKKKAPAKADPKKGGAFEEITDNRPRTVSFCKDFGPEGLGLRVTEQVALQLASQSVRVLVFEVNRETQEEKLSESLVIDLSCLLFPAQKSEFEWTYDKLKALPIHYLRVKIEADQALLSAFLRKKLNPLQITVVAAKNVPYKMEPRYKPIYMVCRFVDEQKFRVDDRP